MRARGSRHRAAASGMHGLHPDRRRARDLQRRLRHRVAQVAGPGGVGQRERDSSACRCTSPSVSTTVRVTARARLRVDRLSSSAGAPAGSRAAPLRRASATTASGSALPSGGSRSGRSAGAPGDRLVGAAERARGDDGDERERGRRARQPQPPTAEGGAREQSGSTPSRPTYCAMDSAGTMERAACPGRTPGTYAETSQGSTTTMADRGPYWARLGGILDALGGDRHALFDGGRSEFALPSMMIRLAGRRIVLFLVVVRERARRRCIGGEHGARRRRGADRPGPCPSVFLGAPSTVWAGMRADAEQDLVAATCAGCWLFSAASLVVLWLILST